MRTLVIQQEKATIVHLGRPDERHGDVLAYEGSITGPDRLAGVIAGVQHTARQHDETQWDRVVQATFSFEDGDSLTVHGLIRNGTDPASSQSSDRYVRAVVGGTGQFIGASGQVESVRKDDGSYTHTFTLL
jgi:hypothetical protein